MHRVTAHPSATLSGEPMSLLQSAPDVPLAPAPWHLTGSGYILALRMPGNLLDDPTFIPDTLQGSRKGKLAYVMFVDYSASDAGPYHELLYIPGSFRFNQSRHLSITRIYVSTWDSVVNGRNNWGIPKNRCNFAVDYGTEQDNIRLTTDAGTLIAELTLRTRRCFRIPTTTAMVPEKVRTLGQHLGGQQFLYAPSSSGHIKPAQLLDVRCNPELFPDISQGQVVACLRVTDFKMVFPTARVESIAGGQ